MSAAIDYRKLFNARARTARIRLSGKRDIWFLASPPPRPKGRVLYKQPIGPALPPSIGETLILQFCADRGVPLIDITARRRDAETMRIRREVVWKLRRETGLSAAAIGRLIKRDHTTVLDILARQP
jgi:hypothetical protein